MAIEKFGVTLIKNCSSSKTAGQEFVRHVAFPKLTHYGYAIILLANMYNVTFKITH